MTPGAYTTFTIQLTHRELDTLDVMIEEWRGCAPFLHITRDIEETDDDGVTVAFTMVTEEPFDDPEETIVGWIKSALETESERWG
ncbi:MAG: hypothetical protein GY906_37555 [bacterium]|nr:hypothetical protein [bacterium]